MFETSFFKPQKNFGRKALGAPLSLAVHVVLGLMLIVIPLLRPGELPKVQITDCVFAPPTPPSLPPGIRRGSGRKARIKPVQAQPNVEAGKLIAPLNIPDKIAEETLVGIDGGDPNGIDGGDPNGILGGIAGPVIEKVLGTPEEPIKAVGEIRPPKLLKQVAPIYPEVARQARVDGLVIIEATTDIYGRVAAWKVLRSIPVLDQAAIDAVRQWVYEPMIINGRPRSVIFTVTVRFVLART